MNPITKCVQASSTNPWENLAIEQYLLENIRPDEAILYLWQNKHTVVIGRNQNAWRECNIALFEKEAGRLARRLSGGGAVYHDLGNLNFTFIMDKKRYDIKRQLQVILDALKMLNIEAQFSGRNDLLVLGRKFSGNAFYYGKNASLHHGTLLVATDFAKMARYLQVSSAKLQAKGIASVQSRVTNLRELVPDLTISGLSSAIKTAFRQHYGRQSEDMTVDKIKQTEQFKQLYDLYASKQWRFGKSPAFTISYKEHFAWGEIEIGFNIKQGKIIDAKIYSDAMNADLIATIADRLVGLPFDNQVLVASLQRLNAKSEHREINDLSDWLSKN